MPTYDVRCLICGRGDEIFRTMGTPNPPCPECGGEMETLITNTNSAIWYCECPTASHGCRGNSSRAYGFVDDSGKEHGIKYHHGTPVKNRYKSGSYCGEHDGTGREDKK